MTLGTEGSQRDASSEQAPEVRDAESCAQAHSPPNDGLISSVGQLTRRLHDILRELGYDRGIERAAQVVPDARDRLSYVASITEQAATRSLNAVEIARPMQERLGVDAGRLAQAWEAFFLARLDPEAMCQLAEDTCRFLEVVRHTAQATAAQLLEILMAQEFQDLTGQVLRRLTHAVHEIEQQLLKLLIDQAPAAKRQQFEENGLLSGPVVDAEGRTDVVTSQQQVDDLLESLGF
jgi:chemotaxis protein CheZ